MSKLRSIKCIKFILVIFSILIYSRGLVALIIANRGNELFFDNDSPASIKSVDSSIKTGIIVGAGYFLDGYAHTLTFLRIVEVSEIMGLDQNELKKQIEQAVEDMTMARDIYKTLKLTSDATPYNPYMIERLLSFDYATFQESKGLSAAVYAEVTAYLQKGDVRGVFGKLYSGSETILEMLTSIMVDVEKGQCPETEKLWRINDAFSDTLRFGQYAAEVFFAIGN